MESTKEQVAEEQRGFRSISECIAEIFVIEMCNVPVPLQYFLIEWLERQLREQWGGK